MQIEPLHAARLANAEGALCALLREAATGEHPNDQPDGLTVELDGDGLTITYTRAGLPVGGEGL